MKTDPQSPLRANFRYLRRVMETMFGGKVEHVPQEYLVISRAFKNMGGSWERLFLGSVDDFALLKKLLKIAFKKGFLTKGYKWED